MFSFGKLPLSIFAGPEFGYRPGDAVTLPGHTTCICFCCFGEVYFGVVVSFFCVIQKGKANLCTGVNFCDVVADFVPVS